MSRECPNADGAPAKQSSGGDSGFGGGDSGFGAAGGAAGW